MRLTGVLRGEEDRQPAVGDLPGQLEVLRADGREVEREVVACRVDGQLERLAGAVGQRQREELAVVGHGLAGERRADDGDVLPRPRERLVETHAVPALRHLRARDAEAEAEAAGTEQVEGGRGHRRHGRGPRRDLEDGGAQVDPLGAGGEETQHGRGVRPVRLGAPDDGVSQPFGLLDQGHDVGGAVGRAGPEDVAEAEREFHPREITRRLARSCAVAETKPGESGRKTWQVGGGGRLTSAA